MAPNVLSRWNEESWVIAMLPESIKQLIRNLQILPGVGPKSARRMVTHLLERNRSGAERLARAILHALGNVSHCLQCRNWSESDVCGLCRSEKRQSNLVCVVESPADVMAVEQTGIYSGRYFVLHGLLSPLDGVGPDALGLPMLVDRLQHPEIKEVVLALSATMEGEVTAQYITDAIPDMIKVSRLASGIPVGGELDYLDSSTLAVAFNGRREVEHS